MLAKLNAFLDSIAGVIVMLLPDSPFAPVIKQITKVDWLGNLNWFVPVGTFLSIGGAWLVAIGIFYIYQMILRWAKVVAD